MSPRSRMRRAFGSSPRNTRRGGRRRRASPAPHRGTHAGEPAEVRLVGPRRPHDRRRHLVRPLDCGRAAHAGAGVLAGQTQQRWRQAAIDILAERQRELGWLRIALEGDRLRDDGGEGRVDRRRLDAGGDGIAAQGVDPAANAGSCGGGVVWDRRRRGRGPTGVGAAVAGVGAGVGRCGARRRGQQSRHGDGATAAGRGARGHAVASDWRAAGGAPPAPRPGRVDSRSSGRDREGEHEIDFGGERLAGREGCRPGGAPGQPAAGV